MESQLLIDSSELLKTYDLPVLIKNKLLLSPGTWNNVKYSAKEIKDAYTNTDWNNKSNCQLYLDHQDTKEAGVGGYAGFVTNPRLVGDDLKGDLMIWNPLLAVYLTKAKAKFGISATLKGFENEKDNKMQNFHFESFSIVTNPACKPAFINLSEEGENKIITPAVFEDNINHKQLKGGKMEEVKKLQEEEKKEEEAKETEESTEEKAEEETTETEEKKEESTETLAKKKEYPYPVKEKKQAVKKKKKPEEDEDDVDEEDLASITTNSEWTDFVKKIKAKYPEMGFKDIAKAFKQKSKKQEELEEKSDEDLVEQLTQIISVLKRRKKYPEPEEKEEEKLEKMDQKIKELENKLGVPDKKTVNLSSSGSDSTDEKLDPYTGMAKFIEEISGSGGGLTFSI